MFWNVRAIPRRPDGRRKLGEIGALVEDGALLGAVIPVMQLKSVDFPAPFGPTRPWTSPGCTRRRPR